MAELADTLPASLQLRAQLEDLALKDLLGPAGGPNEIVEEPNVRGRYIVGLLAPKGQTALPDDDDDDLAEGGRDTEDGAERDGNWLGILIDERQRFSLTHFQVVLWTLVLLSLLAAIFLARLFGGTRPAALLDVEIPPEVLTLAGISGGSAVVATAIKSPRTTDIRAKIAEGKKPTHFSQVFMVEEGESIDKVIDVTRFQNFFLTIIAVGAYVVLAVSDLAGTAVPTGYPGFNQDLLWLIGISHATYVGGKFPQKQ